MELVTLVASIVTAGIGQQASDWLIHPDLYPATVIEQDGRVELTNGLVRRVWVTEPNGACVGLDNLVTGESVLRAVKPEGTITIDGQVVEIGGLTGQPNHAYLAEAFLEGMSARAEAMTLTRTWSGPIEARMEWAQVRHAAPDVAWPPKGRALHFEYELSEAGREHLPGRDVVAQVHYEIYEGLPLFCKWISIENRGEEAIRIDSFRSELLAAVEASSAVGGDGRSMPTPNLHVETDYAFGGGMASGEAVRQSVRWSTDPEYLTQVNYERKTPCLLEVGPEIGPGQIIAPGETFDSFRTWELVHDSTDRERQGMAIRRMYRTIAPWVTENPLMMHVRWSDWDTVRNAVDQCAAVGFEMVILTFGSGFNIEDDSAEYLAEMRRLSAYAQSKGVEIGGYSLLASRRIDEANDVVMPEGRRPTFGNSPCLESAWGRAYFAKLYAFFEKSGFSLLEHDGSYPGDPCTSDTHPGHTGWEDSQWNQWKKIAEFYAWCRARGVYLNVPDWYYLAGSNKCGMGYRETNWSLPREQQVIHTRQNIFDGTWEKTPSMGWMFVPLTEYHGGGAAATIEPLAEHLDHYEQMLMSNLAFGVQACYRGPRLYDTEETRDMVKRCVDWYLKHRDILESDVVHGRRADGRDIDWALHVNPRLETPGMLVVFNPLDHEVEREITVDLYYTGIGNRAGVRERDGAAVEVDVDRGWRARVRVQVPAGGMNYYTIVDLGSERGG